MPALRIKQRVYNHVIKGEPLKIAPEEQKVKMYFKSGNSTMLLCKGLTKLAANNLDIYIDRFCKQHGSKLEGTFIFTR